MTLLFAILLACSPASIADSGDTAAVESDCPIRFVDADGDGYGYGGGLPSCGLALDGVVDVGGDCTDSDAAISPAAAEVCDGYDNDCDGDRDEGC